MWAMSFLITQKLLILNNHPMGENSPNLVTLVTEKQTISKLRIFMITLTRQWNSFGKALRIRHTSEFSMSSLQDANPAKKIWKIRGTKKSLKTISGTTLR
jgi:hypothetical protein